MQEERLKEFFETLIEEMESMKEEIRVLNEKQNQETNNGMQKHIPTDDSKQLSIDGL